MSLAGTRFWREEQGLKRKKKIIKKISVIPNFKATIGNKKNQKSSEFSEGREENRLLDCALCHGSIYKFYLQ